MESIIEDQIIDHLTTNKLIRETQFGFMKRRSCLLNLLTYLEELTNNIDNDTPVDVIYLDYSKAFDRVPHQRLKIVLMAHGINGKTLDWIMAWLKERTQYVSLEGSSSTTEEVVVLDVMGSDPYFNI